MLRAGLGETEVGRAAHDAAQALLLAELVRQERAPETMFGSKVSPRDAQRRTKTAVALGDGSLPGAADALAAGEISFEHAAALAAIKDRLPEGTAEAMLPLAKVLSPDKFARALQREAIPVEVVGDSSTGTNMGTGGRWFRFGYDGHEGTIVLNGLERAMDRAWRRDHPERAEEKLDRPLYGQRMAAALLEMARREMAGYTGHRPPSGQPLDGDTADGDTTDVDTTDVDTTDAAPAASGIPAGWTPGKAIPAEVAIMIVISYEKMYGDAEAAGICTTIDGVPLPVETVRKLLVDAKIYPVVLGGDGEILDFGRSRRFFSAAQKNAAAVRDMSCQFADCDKPIRYADYHHCVPWANGGLTDIANAAPACDGCHDKLTNHGYRIERRNGIVYTYGPDGQLIHQRNNRWQK
jgi:hypothetical protein